VGAEAFLPTNPEVTGVKDRPVRSALDVEICAVVAEIRGVVSREEGLSTGPNNPQYPNSNQWPINAQTFSRRGFKGW